MAASGGGGVKDRLVSEFGRAIKQAQSESCSLGCVRICTSRWLILSIDAILIHGLVSLARGYWPLISNFLDRTTLGIIHNLPYARSHLAKGRTWISISLNEHLLENYLHVLTSHPSLLKSYYACHGLLLDSERTQVVLMLSAGLEHLKINIPMDTPGWIESRGSVGSLSMMSISSSLPSPSQSDHTEIDMSCSEAMEESWCSTEGDISSFTNEESDASIEIEHFSKRGSRRKRRNRSTSRSSSKTSSVTTPTDLVHSPISVEEVISSVNQRHIPEKKLNSDDIYENNVFVDEEKECEKESKKLKNFEDCYHSEKPNRRHSTESYQARECGDSKKIWSDLSSQEDQGKKLEEKSSVLRRNTLSSSKNLEKRVSFNSATLEQKKMHNRLSWSGELGKGEIRDLSDLRELLSSLRDRGVLPSTLALDDLLTNLDQSEPTLCERAPPEGQEDPPLHQSITSLVPQNSISDSDNNNNEAPSENETGKEEFSDTKEKSEKCETELVLKDDLQKFGPDFISSLRKNSSAPSLDRNQNGALLTDSSDTVSLSSAQSESSALNFKSLGAKPKNRQLLVIQSDLISSGSSLEPKTLAGHMNTLRERIKVQKFEQMREAHRRQRLPVNRLPNMYIPYKIDPAKYKEENMKLTIEIAQAQSNMNVPKEAVDTRLKESIVRNIFCTPDEKLYKTFSVREGHSSGQTVGVKLVLSTYTVYVVKPATKLGPPRHAINYEDIHTIIIGANDLWVCIVDKQALGNEFKSTMQLDVGDPEITRDLVSSLEVAVRRRYSALKQLARESILASKKAEIKGNSSGVEMPVSRSDLCSNGAAGEESDAESKMDSETLDHSKSQLENTSNTEILKPKKDKIVLQHYLRNPLYYTSDPWMRWNGCQMDCYLPGVIVHPAWELSGLRSWLRSQLRLQNTPNIMRCWFADWEDGSSLSVGNSVDSNGIVCGPLGPALEGPLMYKQQGILGAWKPAYFILKAGVLYQFNDSSERLPQNIVEVGRCVGCVRLPPVPRPHAFQLLRKHSSPVMLASPDEHQASLWLQAFLTLINTGICDLSERRQVSCRVVMIEDSIVLTRHSGLLPSYIPDKETDVDKKEEEAEVGNKPPSGLPKAVRQSSLEHNSNQSSQTKAANLSLLAVKDRKPLSTCVGNLNHIGSSASLPSSPIKRLSVTERSAANQLSPPPLNKKMLNRQGSLPRLNDSNLGESVLTVKSDDKSLQVSLKEVLPPTKKKPRSSAVSKVNHIHEEIPPSLVGDVCILTSGTFEHLTAVFVYSECPNTCVLEFECSEAGEVSGDWILYFRTKAELNVFLEALRAAWNEDEMDFPLKCVEDSAIQQYLLEGTQLSYRGWESMSV